MTYDALFDRILTKVAPEREAALRSAWSCAELVAADRDVSQAAMFDPCCSRHLGGSEGICGVSPRTKSRDAFGSASSVLDRPFDHACSRAAP